MSAIDVLAFIGILLIIGFLAQFLFKKINLPDILILLVLGYLVGPVFHIIDPANIRPASQIISVLSLVVILFSESLNLEFRKMLKSAPRALILIILGIAGSMVATAALVHYVFQWGFMNSILLGAIVSGTSPAIVMSLISRTRAPAEVSSLLNLESAFNGALVIVIALIVLDIITTGSNGNELAFVGRTIGLKIAIGAGVGLFAGFFWLCILSLLEGEVYDDILTLAVVFLFYYGVEGIGGSGVIFTLIFGLILGNGVEIARALRIRRAVEVHGLMKKFHLQISFLIKTFFFVYLGLMVAFNDVMLVLQGIVISVVLLFVRYIAVLLTTAGSKTLSAHKGVITTMLPRGLSAAVVAELVVASAIPDAPVYPDLIIVVIIVTVLIAAIGIPLFTRRRAPNAVEQYGQLQDY
jgi:cell volume regulation protein A